MSAWDPALYLQFGGQRLRPALDLIARIPVDAPRRVYDLGCGPGTVSKILRQRWPGASITGVDASPAMLDRARSSVPELQWELADLQLWQAPAPADVVFSNAALHWLDDHETLLPRLLSSLGQGGALAVQMPQNFSAPTHTAIGETIRSRSWGADLAAHFRADPVASASEYYELLAPRASEIDVWETTYLHVLEGEDPVVEWTKGSILGPVLERLGEQDRRAFLDAYRRRIQEAYPRRPDGKTLLPFKRLFFVAVA